MNRIRGAVDVLDQCCKRMPAFWQGAGFERTYPLCTMAVSVMEHAVIEDYGRYPGLLEVYASRREEAHGRAVSIAGQLEVPVWADV